MRSLWLLAGLCHGLCEGDVCAADEADAAALLQLRAHRGEAVGEAAYLKTIEKQEEKQRKNKERRKQKQRNQD